LVPLGVSFADDKQRLDLAMIAAADLAADFSAAEIEAGRRLFAGEWNFLSAAGSVSSLPAMAGPEIAFAGRSNVGKSSLINALTGRRALARISNTPGRTQELIFFGRGSTEGGSGGGRLVLVDMPGYGYATAAKSKIAAWTRLIHDYLRGRAALARVYLLVDARHGVMAADENILATLDQAAVSYQIVLTKSDCVTPADLASRSIALQTLLARHPAAYPAVLATSARTGAGVAELRAAIGRLLRERLLKSQ
jgi:GTP-binding protein